VEQVLYTHPAVAEVVVVGVPDAQWGEAVKAVIVLRPKAKVSAAELVGYCTGRLAGYKKPKSVDFVEELPRGPTGKILRRIVRERYWLGRERKIN
jgi:acyl-CoA synthetase (AMP-forming)/AMP-acid ligase II